MVKLQRIKAALAVVGALGAGVLAYPSGSTVAAVDAGMGQLLALRSNANSSGDFLSTLSAGQRNVFTTTLSMMDANFQPPYIFASSRYTAYYAVVLLARNSPGDVQLAT